VVNKNAPHFQKTLKFWPIVFVLLLRITYCK